jgi:signal transduction histidine kinase
VGVGLAGMQERVREQGGQFRIRSDETGTTIEVKVLLSAVSGPPNMKTATAEAD